VVQIPLGKWIGGVILLELNLTLDAFSVYVVVVDILLLLGYTGYLYIKKKRLAQVADRISQFVKGYFANSGITVDSECLPSRNIKGFILLIESSPLKSFRYSNLVEASLIGHIEQVTGHHVEQIFWRFPIRVAESDQPTAGNIKSNADDQYLRDAQSEVRSREDYKVEELSLDDFNRQV